MTYISTYRGYQIYKLDDGSFGFGRTEQTVSKHYPLFNTAWGAIEYIDELLSP